MPGSAIRRRSVTRKRDELLDHDADGIREFDNDLPRWWLWTLYVTVIWSVVYLINYHLLSAPFLGERTIAAEYQAEVVAAGTPTGLPAPSSAGAPVATAHGSLSLLTDAESLAKGKALYNAQTSMCATCHRADLGGLVGPDLTDDFWLHGCSVAAIAASVQVGFPTRGMPPFGGGPALTVEQLQQLSSYILSTRGSAPAGAKPKDPERDVACSS
jgi:cytochrome c oxidase cbb3-type subunit 3